jgi:hypothetical protein
LGSWAQNLYLLRYKTPSGQNHSTEACGSMEENKTTLAHGRNVNNPFDPAFGKLAIMTYRLIFRVIRTTISNLGGNDGQLQAGSP